MDRILDTVVAGGAEILGLHATVAPRRQHGQSPTLEQFKYIPHVQNKVRTTEELREYISVLERHIQQSLKALLHNGASQTVPNHNLLKKIIIDTAEVTSEEVTAEEVSRYTDDTCSLLSLLKNVYNQTHNESFVKNVDNVLSSASSVFTSDQLLTNLLHVNTLKPCLDLSLENGSLRKIKICEIGAADSQSYERLISQLNTQPMLKVDYTLTGDKLDTLNNEALEEQAIKCVPWDMQSDKPKALNNFDLVFYNYGLHKQQNLQQILARCLDMLSPRGFMLVHEPTQHFSIPLAISGITTDFSAHTGRTFGPYHDQVGWETVFINAGMEIISTVSDDLSTLFLCRRTCTSSLPGGQTIISVEGADFSWVERVKECMSAETPAGQNIWLTSLSPESYHNGIIGMLNCLKQEPGGEKIR